jgi:ribosomal protein L37AE/L43A
MEETRGYQDLASSAYGHDNKVQYHAQVPQGDLAVVVVDDRAEGIARIAHIEVCSGTKTLQRCPRCKTTDIARRRTVFPTYRCNRCRQTFEHPKHDEIEVDVHEAEAHFTEWVPLNAVSRDDIRTAALNRGQTAIRPLNVSKLRQRLRLRPDALRLVP